MGGGMAGRLIDAKVPLTVWNRRASRAEPFKARGASVASSPREATADADIVICMVSDDAASREVWTGPDGALGAVKLGAVVIDASTLSPLWVEELAGLAEERGCALLDAPVTGSRPHAQNGELTFLVGGDPDVLERARPVLTPMSKAIVYLGPTGSGARMKLVNNLMAGAQAAVLAEALAMTEAVGLDRDAALTILVNGAPGSPLVKTVGPRMLARDYDVNFHLSLMRKDLSYAVDEAARHGVTLQTVAAARDLFAQAVSAGLGDEDFAAVIEPLRRAPQGPQRRT
jgi:3-hydroxyisobutyrate dehydrogenase